LRGTDGLGAENYSLWHYIDIEAVHETIHNSWGTGTILLEWNNMAFEIADQMTAGIKQVIASNDGQVEIKEEAKEVSSWKWAKVFSMVPEPDVSSLIEEMISQAKEPLETDAQKQVAKWIFENIKTSTSPLSVEPKDRNLWNQYKPTFFYHAPIPIAHWTQVVPSDSDGSNGSNGSGGDNGSGGSNGSTSNGSPSALPLVGAATSNDVLTLRTGPTVPAALQPGAQIRVTAFIDDDSDDDSDDDTYQDPVEDPNRPRRGLRGRHGQTPGPATRGLGARTQREYTFNVTRVSGPYSNGKVEVRVKEQVPGALSQAVSRTAAPVAARIIAPEDDSGGSDNGSNGGSDNGSNGGSDNGSGGGSNGDNNASIGPGVPSPQPQNKIVSGVSNVTVFTAGGVLLTGLLAALFDEDPPEPRQRR